MSFPRGLVQMMMGIRCTRRDGSVRSRSYTIGNRRRRHRILRLLKVQVRSDEVAEWGQLSPPHLVFARLLFAGYCRCRRRLRISLIFSRILFGILSDSVSPWFGLPGIPLDSSIIFIVVRGRKPYNTVGEGDTGLSALVATEMLVAILASC